MLKKHGVNANLQLAVVDPTTHLLKSIQRLRALAQACQSRPCQRSQNRLTTQETP